MAKIHIFTDCDLDGAGSYLVYSWLSRQTNIPYTVCRVNDLYNKLKAFVKKRPISSYDMVYFFDLDTSDERIREMIDLPNVTIVDHHESNDIHKYTQAKLYVTPATSTCKLLYTNESLYEHPVLLSPAQRLLIALVDDYDSYELKSPWSKQLNTVFWSYQGDRVQKLARDFPNGFTGFNKFKKNIIDIKARELKEVVDNLEIFTRKLKTNNREYLVASTVATTFINEVADHIADRTDAHVSIVVNTKSNKVSFRRRKGLDTLSMVKLASTLTDESGGHDAASGGILCEKFLTFTKTLEPFVG